MALVIPPLATVVPGRSSGTAGRFITTGHPFIFADQPVADPEVPGYFLAPRMFAGKISGARGRVYMVGIPQLIGGPEPERSPVFMRHHVFRNDSVHVESRFMPHGRRFHFVEFSRRYATISGRFRVFGATEYRIYRSNVAPPTEDDVPWETTASLPYTPADTFADGTWYLSMSYFNGVIDSGFLPIGAHGETYLRLDISSGESLDLPPDPPIMIALTRSETTVRVTATYSQADALRATEWAIAYTTNGSDPAESSPSITQTIPASGVARLNYTLPAAGSAVTYKVRVQVRRSSRYSEGSEVYSLTNDVTPPGFVSGYDSWPGPTPEEL